MYIFLLYVIFFLSSYIAFFNIMIEILEDSGFSEKNNDLRKKKITGTENAPIFMKF